MENVSKSEYSLNLVKTIMFIECGDLASAMLEFAVAARHYNDLTEEERHIFDLIDIMMR